MTFRLSSQIQIRIGKSTREGMNRAVTYLNEAANPSSPALFFFNRTGIAQTGLSDTILKS